MNGKPSSRRQLSFSLGPEAARRRGGGWVRAVRLNREAVEAFDRYPFGIPAVRSLERLELHPAVTFFVGENGSGKSTLLEALAVRLGYNAEGGNRNHQFATRETHSALHQHLVVERNPGRPGDGWFLRAESLYNVASYLDDMNATAHSRASLHAHSHGEAFLSLLTNRLKGGGLYLFDEPEAALSPQRQLAVLTLLHQLVCRNSQLIIATHSPILLSYPHARIYEFSERGIVPREYEETEHYRVTRDFLQSRERMLELLLEETG